MERLAIKHLVLATVLFLPLSAFADYEVGVSAYKRGDYVVALREFRRAALAGNAEAKHYIGIMYYQGRGVSRDMQEAIKWFREAAQDGRSESQFNLGLIYVEGQGVPVDYSEGLKWLRKAAAQNNADAQGMLGAAYANGQGVRQDFVFALAWIAVATQNGCDRLRQFVPRITDRMTEPEKEQSRIIAARLAGARDVEAQLNIEKERERGSLSEKMLGAMAERGPCAIPDSAPNAKHPQNILSLASAESRKTHIVKTKVFTVPPNWLVVWQAGPASRSQDTGEFSVYLYRGADSKGEVPMLLIRRTLVHPEYDVIAKLKEARGELICLL